MLVQQGTSFPLFPPFHALSRRDPGRKRVIDGATFQTCPRRRRPSPRTRLRRLIFRTFGHQRFTQDSPILPDVSAGLMPGPTRRIGMT